MQEIVNLCARVDGINCPKLIVDRGGKRLASKVKSDGAKEKEMGQGQKRSHKIRKGVESKMSGMKYKKCKDCPHCERYYAMGGGLYMVCKIEGDVLEITECPKKHKCECESCKRHAN